jgi:hypothetical protein
MAEVLLHWHPPVGVFIGILGFLGIVVPLVRDLAKMGKWEKAGWTGIMFALMGLELLSIHIDRKDHEAEQAAARAELLTNFQHIADGIKNEIDNSQSEFDATMKRSDSILGGVGETIKIANGGDSFAFIEMTPVAAGFDIYIIQDGTHHLLDVVGRISDLDHPVFDPSGETTLDTMPILYRGTARKVGTLSVPATTDYKRFNVFLHARNGVFDELYRIKRINGGWTNALMVQVAYYNMKGRIACEIVNKDFPVELLKKDSDWAAYEKLPKFRIKGDTACPK